MATSENLLNSIVEGTPRDVVERYASFRDKAQKQDFFGLDSNVVIVDTETTGISFKKDELTQIAAARMEKGEIVDWYVTFVNPGRPISDDISHLTHIYDSDVCDAPTPNEAIEGLVEFVGDAKLVAHNAAFDRAFLTNHVAGYPLLENQWIDSLQLARISLPKMRSHRLIDLVKAFDAPLSTHRADDDVSATCALYRILLAAVSSLPIALLEKISTLDIEKRWPTVVVFKEMAKGMSSSESIEGAAERFSLRAMRANRNLTEHFKDKKDAADMVSSELVEASSMNVHVFGSGIPSQEGGPTAGQDEQGMGQIDFPTPEDIDEAFSESGLVGKIFAGEEVASYERREEQLAMAQAVREAFALSKNLAVEAGTGVGKSMAYLVPSVLTAIRNNITIGIATKTNALLDQLVYKELPALSSMFAMEGAQPGLTYTSLKGFIHYPCLLRIQSIAEHGARMVDVQGEEMSQAPAIAAILSFIEQTSYGDLDALKIDYRVLPKKAITTTSHDCLRRKCPFYGQSCFVHGSRLKAEGSDIVVTNHSLLFCDAAADGGLLPPIRYWVVDEAHGAESEARRAFSTTIAADDLQRLATKASAQGTKNVFEKAERNISTGNTMFFSLTSKAKACGADFAKAAEEFTSHFKDLLYFNPQKKSKYDIVEIWVNQEVRGSERFGVLRGLAKEMSERAERLIGVAQDLVVFLEDEKGAAQVQRDIASLALDLKDMVSACKIIFESPTDEYVYSVTLSQKGDEAHNRFEAMPFSVGSKLEETLYANTRSVVFTSATLSVNDRFDALDQAISLGLEGAGADSLMLKSSYDFDRNMVVYVASDMPEPSSPKYLEALQDFLVRLHIAQGGSILTLFTNKKEMEACFSEVYPQLKDNDLRLVRQRWGVSSKTLRDDFLADESLSLFALKSFWEGFDAPGDALRGVVIPKLPFAKPSDPLSNERASRDDQAWRNYVLPQAVLEMKQAAGRLIRKADDKGALVLADSRLVSKSYGKVFLNSLPSKNVNILTIDEIVEKVAQAHADGPAQADECSQGQLQEQEQAQVQANPSIGE